APTAALRRRWRRTGLRLIGATLRQVRAYPRAIQQVRLAARAYRRIDWTRLSDAELIESAEQIARMQVAFGPAFQLGNMAAAVGSQVLRLAIERVLPGRGERLAAALMGGSGQVVTAEHAYRLFDLAVLAAGDADVRAWVLREGDTGARAVGGASARVMAGA